MSPTSASQTSLRSLRKPSARCGARPTGRARLPAFHCGSRQGDFRRPRLSVRPCFRGLGRSIRSYGPPTGAKTVCFSTGVTRAETCPSPASTSRAGRNAGRMMPKPPGSQGDEPKPAGTATRSAGQGHRPASSQGSEMGFFYFVTRCAIKKFRRANPSI
jgi:hypothetical protein